MKHFLYITIYLIITGTLYSGETGVFKLTDSAGIEQLNFPSGTALYLYLIDPDQNTNVLESETVTVNVISDTETTPELVSLYETGQNTGNFIGSIVFDAVNSTSIGDGKLQVQKGDKLTGIYIDPYDDFNNEKTITDISLYGATTQSGTISENTTWSKANSPYLITGDVTVVNTITLTIDPGVEVRFVANTDDLASGYYANRSELRIEGILRAIGTIEDSIIFTSNAEVPAVGNWGGIKVLTSSSKALLNYCRIEYGNYGLEISGNTSTSDRDTILVENSLFQYGGTSLYQCSSCGYHRPIYFNNNTVINADAVHLEYEIFSAEIKNNTITNGRIYCRIQRGSNSVDSLYNNIDISGNSLTFSEHYDNNAIQCELDINGNILNINFNNNIIVGLVYTGIWVYQNNSYTNAKAYLTMMGNQIDNVRNNGIQLGNNITSALIKNNTITNSGGSYNNSDNSSNGSGIRISTSRNCNIEIVDNFIEGSGTWGMHLDRTIGRIDSNIVLNNGFGGIYLNGVSNYTSSDTLTYNIITGTGYNSGNNSSYSYQGSGIYNTGYSRPVIQYNHLFDNYSYEIYNNTDAELNCKYNLWGAETNAEIAAAPSNPTNLTKIYDSYDNNDKGWVNYGAYKADPILSPPQIPVNLFAVENSYPAHLNWSPVTSINLLRYNIYRQDEINDWEYINSVYTSPGQDTLFRDNTVRNNTSYSYRITAESFENTESAFSNEVNMITGIRPTWHVSTSGSDSNDGSSANPFKTIQKAVDTAYGAKDTILILPGTYFEAVHIEGNKSLIIGSQFMTDNDTSNVSSTIIDGNQISSPISINDSAAVIKLIGLTISRGKDANTMSTGSGIYISYADSLILDRMIVKNNESDGYGGGIYCRNTNYLSIGNSWIHNNSSNNNGGGVSVRENVHYFELYNSIVSNNTAGSSQNNHRYGGGLDIDNGVEKAIMRNNVIAFNTSRYGPALRYDAFEDSLLLLNNIFYSNYGYYESENDVSADRQYIVAISNYFDEFDSNAMSNFGRYTLNINVNRNPFVNSGANNFALSDSSQAINSGILSTTFFGETINVPSTDYYGNSRPYPADTNPDMGAIENSLGTPLLITYVVNKDGTGDFTSIQSAINTALSFEHILVMPGDYTENIDFNGKNIVVKSSGGPTVTSISPSFYIDTIKFDNEETSSTVLDGFTLKNGYYSTRQILISYSSPTIKNCIFTNCSTYNIIYFENSSSKIINCLFENNDSENVFSFYYQSYPQIINCTIVNNKRVGNLAHYSQPTQPLFPYFKNSIIYENMSFGIGTETENISITYSLVDGGWSGTGNINADPLFIDLENGDYSLQATSPCIDTGDPDLDGDGISWQFDPDDQDLDGTRSDMGYSSDYYSCDQCGVCDYDALNNCVQDCIGEWGGSSEIDCNDVCNGTAYLDDCDICSGGDTDHIANNDMNECGVCISQYNCEPILLTDEDDFTAVSLRDSVLRFEFSVPMDTLSFSGITLQSAVLSNITYHAENDTGVTKKVDLVIESTLASRDTLTVVFPSTLQSNYNYGFDGDQDGTAGDALSFTIYTETLADYNHDNQIDIDDLSIFTSAWYGKEYNFELGPVSGTAPNFIPVFDSTYNIEDMSVLMLMWNWANGFATPRMGRHSVVNEPSNFSIKNDILGIDLLPFHDIATIYIQINTLSPNIHFIEVDNQSTFDLSLSRKWEEENIYEWNFANFSKKKIDDLDICRLESNIAHNEEMFIDYKISSLSGAILSSGSMALEYFPVPDKFILHSAYPNPFNPTTQLKYGLSKNIHVSITIYDIVGRRIAELINKKQQAGYHQVVWDGNHHASGLYFVKMTAGDYISTQKLMLVK